MATAEGAAMHRALKQMSWRSLISTHPNSYWLCSCGLVCAIPLLAQHSGVIPLTFPEEKNNRPCWEGLDYSQVMMATHHTAHVTEEKSKIRSKPGCGLCCLATCSSLHRDSLRTRGRCRCWGAAAGPPPPSQRGRAVAAGTGSLPAQRRLPFLLRW